MTVTTILEMPFLLYYLRKKAFCRFFASFIECYKIKIRLNRRYDTNSFEFSRAEKHTFIVRNHQCYVRFRARRFQFQQVGCPIHIGVDVNADALGFRGRRETG